MVSKPEQHRSPPIVYDLAALHARVMVIGEPGEGRSVDSFLAALKAELDSLRVTLRT